MLIKKRMFYTFLLTEGKEPVDCGAEGFSMVPCLLQSLTP